MSTHRMNKELMICKVINKDPMSKQSIPNMVEF